MKILMVTRESHADKRYGLGKTLTPLINELTKRGIEIGYICQEDAGHRSLMIVRRLHSIFVKLFGRFFVETEFPSLWWGILERLNMGRLAVKVMANEQYTHVHCHDPIIGAGFRWFARLRWYGCFCRCDTARWGVTEHGFGCYAQAFHLDGARLGSRVMRWLRAWEAKVLLKAHWVMTPTQSGLEQLQRDLSVYPKPAHWHHIYHPRPILTHYSKSEARQHLGWTEHDFYLIAVGRLAVLKQFSLLIRACADLRATDWKLVLIGDGDRTALQALATELGIAERVLFTVTDDISWYYSAADIYVSTSATESFGFANLEALTMGLPCVCTAVGGVPEVVGSGARLVTAGDMSALVNTLQSLLDDANSRHYWAQQARHWTQNWPNVSMIADSYLAVIEGQPIPNLNRSPTRPQSRLLDWHEQVTDWPICPLPKRLELPSDAKILVIAPHSDDEIFGCGGTLALLRQRGCDLKVVIMTDGSQGDPKGYSDETVKTVRQRESIAALGLLGIDDVMFLGETDGNFRYSPAVEKQLHSILDDFAPNWFFLPSIFDYHRDHIAVSLSVLSVWQQRGYQERVFFYEIWQTLPATWIVDISTVFALKQQAVQCYQLPLKYYDYLTVVIGLAQYRSLNLIGHSGQYAEAFLELEKDSSQSVLSNLFGLRRYQNKFFES
jgi:LmbE family N-acetylglucosaminyl deacetylase/glycosyltransferase involved in cell wall biosynthesis